MKTRIFFFVTLFIIGVASVSAQNCCTGSTDRTSCCKGVAVPDCCKSDSTAVQNISPSTLIVYYTGSNRRVLKLAREIGAEVIYSYRNINAVAVRKPENMTLDEAKQRFERLKNVAQVSYDHVYKLD